MSDKTDKKQILFLVLAVFFVYFNSLPNEFIFDDVPLVQNSLWITSGNFADILRSYRPLRYISYALDYRIFGMNPAGFRLMNMIYHALSVLALFWALKMFGLTKRAAFVSALIFAVHPVNTDAVAYISGRRDVLMGLFYILSIGCFFKFYRTVSPAERAASGTVKKQWVISQDCKKQSNVTLAHLLGHSHIKSPSFFCCTTFWKQQVEKNNN